MDSQDDYEDPKRWQIKRHESVQGCHVRGALSLERQLVEEHHEEGKDVPQIRITLPSLRRIYECAASGCDVCSAFADNVPEPSSTSKSKLSCVSRLIHHERRVSFVRYVDGSGGNVVVLRRGGSEIGRFVLPVSLERYNFMRER